MTGREPRFSPRPRSGAAEPPAHDEENLRRELLRVRARAERVRAAGRDAFVDGSESYDIASMAIIRLAALLERAAPGRLAERLAAEEIAAIRTTRNIAAYAGYDGMNDEAFWRAITIRVPEIVDRLLAD